ncbi:hypothetical protein [Burkholderia multivorans]|uniref:hypothetical protein n=1 Tax=Burkholderia multivorans TaxID=87883 RepID=UPI000AAE9F95|nr:hypothetical protein [Burkholderia multivorans]
MEYRIETDSREKKSAKKRMSFIRRRPFEVIAHNRKMKAAERRAAALPRAAHVGGIFYAPRA